MEVDRGTYTNSRRSSYAGDTNAPVLGIQQFEVVRGKKRVFGSKKHAARKLAKLSEQFQKTAWSAITPNWGTASNLSIGLQYAPGQSTSMPAVLWDLSSLPVSGEDGTFPRYNKPFYTLQKNATTGLYAWVNNAGNIVPANVAGSGYYNNASLYAVVDSGSTPGRQPFFMHDWSSVGISIMGATTRTSRVHIALVEFDNCAVGPLRQYDVPNATGTTWTSTFYDDNASTPDEDSAANFWDRFFSKSVNNPLYKSYIPSDGHRHMRILQKDTIVIGPEATYNEDTRGRQVQKSYFWRFNEVHNASDPLQTLTYDLANQVGVGTTAQTSALNPQGKINTPCNYGAYGRTKYLMVWADIGNAGSFNAAFNPSFDIRITNKHTVKN